MIRRFTSPFAEFGFWPGCVYAADRLLARITPAVRLYFYDFVAQPLAPERYSDKRASMLELREIPNGHADVERMPARREIKQARFEHRALCLGAYRRGELIGYIWFQFKAYEEDEVRCTFAVHPGEHAAFDFDLYIFPQHRMGTAFLGIWSAASRYLRERGFRYSISRVTRFNVASMRAHQRLGAERIASALFLRAGAAEIMVANAAPYFNVSLSRSRRARLDLRAPA